MDPGWVHFNCAIWSSGVVRDDDGLIFGVQNILGHITRYKQKTLCTVCHQPGATIRCKGDKYCHQVFHFLCAKKGGMKCLCEVHIGKSRRHLELEHESRFAWAEAKRVKASLRAQAEAARIEALAQRVADGKGVRRTRHATSRAAAVLGIANGADPDSPGGMNMGTSPMPLPADNETRDLFEFAIVSSVLDELLAAAGAPFAYTDPRGTESSWSYSSAHEEDSEMQNSNYSGTIVTVAVDADSNNKKSQKTLSILRAKYKKKRMEQWAWFEGDKFCFRAGTLTVLNLGQVRFEDDYENLPADYDPTRVSHTPDIIYPVGFRSIRIFWSATSGNGNGKRNATAAFQRCPYLCDIRRREDAAPNSSLNGTLQFIITAGDTMRRFVGATPDEACQKLFAAVQASFSSSAQDGRKGARGGQPFVPLLRNRVRGLARTRNSTCPCWIKDGLKFFGLTTPEVTSGIEQLANAATTALFGPPQTRYRFKYVVPSDAQIATIRRRIHWKKEKASSLRVLKAWVPSTEHEKGLNHAFSVRHARQAGLNDVSDQLALASINGSGSINSRIGIGALNIEAGLAAAEKERDRGELNHAASGLLTNNDAIPLSMRYRSMQEERTGLRIAVRRSGIHGWGVFAKRNIMKDEIITEYVGEKVRQVIADLREAKYDRDHRDGGLLGGCYMFRVDAEHIIDATTKGNHARFVNHSCDANAYARVGILPDNSKHIFIFAKRNIIVGEEVTYDYQFPLEDGEAVPCNCGSQFCIGRMN